MAGTRVAVESGMLRTDPHAKHSRTLLAVLALLGLFSTGCAARVYSRSYVYSEPVVVAEPPQLVYVSPGVYVVRDYDEAVYYSNGYYWCQRGGVWYQTAYWGDPWVHVHVSVVPTTFVHAHHHTYVRYHGAPGAAVYKAPARTYHSASAGAVAAADHRSPPPPPSHGSGSIRRSGPGAQAPASGHVSKAPSSRQAPYAGGATPASADARGRGSLPSDPRASYPQAGRRGGAETQPVSNRRADAPSPARSQPQPAPRASSHGQPASRPASAPPPAAPRASAPSRKQPAAAPAPARSKSRTSSNRSPRS